MRGWLPIYCSGEKRKTMFQLINDHHSNRQRERTELSAKAASKWRANRQQPPITANEPPSTATEPEGEVIRDIAATFADEEEETSSARLPDDKIDEAFEDIRISDIEQENDEDEQPTSKGYATGASFEEIGTAIKIADNPSATPQERKQAGEVFFEMKDNEFYNKLPLVSH